MSFTAMNQAMVNLEFTAFFAELQQIRDRKEVFSKAGAKILAMRKENRRSPTATPA